VASVAKCWRQKNFAFAGIYTLSEYFPSSFQSVLSVLNLTARQGGLAAYPVRSKLSDLRWWANLLFVMWPRRARSVCGQSVIVNEAAQRATKRLLNWIQRQIKSIPLIDAVTTSRPLSLPSYDSLPATDTSKAPQRDVIPRRVIHFILFTKAPSTPATMSKQATLSKLRSTLSKQSSVMLRAQEFLSTRKQHLSKESFNL